MKRKRTTIVAAPAYFELPDECWELVIKFLMHHEENNYLKSLSVVSKYFLSLTNRLRFSLTIKHQTIPYLPNILRRFPNLASFDLKHCRDLNKLLIQISDFSLNLTSLHLSYESTFPVKGLEAFSKKITTLTSLTCSYVGLRSTEMLSIPDFFPNLQLLQILDLNHCYCYGIFEEGIDHILRKCCNIRHLNLARCSGVKLHGINFEVHKLEVLNLSYTDVDDQTLDVISKNCRGLSRLLLENCHNITNEGVMHAIENCTQLREINLRCCVKVLSDVVTSMVSSSPSLRKYLQVHR